MPVAPLPLGANGPWQGFASEGGLSRALLSLASHAALSGSEPPVTRRVCASGPSCQRRHSGSAWLGSSAVSPWGTVGACCATCCASHATVLPSALIDAPTAALGN